MTDKKPNRDAVKNVKKFVGAVMAGALIASGCAPATQKVIRYRYTSPFTIECAPVDPKNRSYSINSMEKNTRTMLVDDTKNIRKFLRFRDAKSGKIVRLEFLDLKVGNGNEYYSSIENMVDGKGNKYICDIVDYDYNY